MNIVYQKMETPRLAVDNFTLLVSKKLVQYKSPKQGDKSFSGKVHCLIKC